VHCWADRPAIGQVLRNILENSLQAAQKCAQIEVRWYDDILHNRPALRLVVQDNGPGLTPEQRARIFDPFYTTKTHGTGLGMAIAKRLVEAHNGQITVGEVATSGTEIHITLPRDRS
jgi:signal transduction histidine kinase